MFIVENLENIDEKRKEKKSLMIPLMECNH